MSVIHGNSRCPPVTSGGTIEVMGERGGRAPSLRLLATLGTLTAGLIALDWWLWLRYGRAPWLAALSSTSASTCFVGAGVLAWHLRPRSRTGPWMVAMGLVMLADTPSSDLMLDTEMPGRSLVVLIGVPAYWLHLAIGVQLFLGYPSGRVSRGLERQVVMAGFVSSVVGAGLLLVTMTSAPQCAGWCGASPLQLVDDLALYVGIKTALTIALASVACTVLVLLARRAVQSSPRQRRILRLMIVAAAVTIVLLCASQFSALVRGAGHGVDVFDLAASWTAVVGLPLAFLLGLLRERLAFASVGSLVRRLEHVAADGVEAALGEVLHDADLRVAYASGDVLLDACGRPFTPPNDGSRMVTKLGDPCFAVLVHDPDLSDNPELLDAAGSAARLALDNARLHAQVRGQLAEVQASRQRVAAAEDVERQRLERDLHDGAQQCLLGVGLALGVLRGRVSEAERNLVDEIEDDLRRAIRELRALAHGIRPAVLTDQGLAPALAGLARRAAVPVTTDIRLGSRLSPMIEATAYYVVSESLQNAVKHTGGADVSIGAVQRSGLLVIDVEDNGPGGASLLVGRGLRGLADRVEAAGGRFVLTSVPGQGTHLIAELPCV